MSGNTIEQLCEQYLQQLHLERHEEVARLACQLQQGLVHLFDHQLEQRRVGQALSFQEEESPLEEDVELEPEPEELASMGALVGLLQERSRLAADYHQVSQFVRLRDSLALAEMLGAVSREGPTFEWRQQQSKQVAELQIRLNFEQLSQVLRCSIQLLGHINQELQPTGEATNFYLNGSCKSDTPVKIDDGHERRDEHPSCWTDRKCNLEQLSSGSGFGALAIHLYESAGCHKEAATVSRQKSAHREQHSAPSQQTPRQPLKEHDICALIEWLRKLRQKTAARCNDESVLVATKSAVPTTTPTSSSDLLAATLAGEQFITFVQEQLCTKYPLDRFTCLVALYIVARECKHERLEELLSEILDQLAHEQTNTTDQEELLSLTQLGAFWLSQHKHCLSSATKQKTVFTSSSSSSSSSFSLEGSDLDSNDSAESETDKEWSLDKEPQGATRMGIECANKQQQRPDDQADEKTRLSHELAAKLRRIIERELFFSGRQDSCCIVCGFQPVGSNVVAASELFVFSSKMNYCARCGHRRDATSTTSNRCALSKRPIQLIGLHSLASCFGRPLRKLLVLQPGEWARAWLQARPEGASLVSTRDAKLEMTSQFERLTLRQPPTNRAAAATKQHFKRAELETEPPSHHDGDINPSWRQIERQAEDGRQVAKIMSSFMRWRHQRQQRHRSGMALSNLPDAAYLNQTVEQQLVANNNHMITFAQKPSESLLMLVHLRDDQKQTATRKSSIQHGQLQSVEQEKSLTLLPVCQSDLLQVDEIYVAPTVAMEPGNTKSSFVRFCLAATDDLADDELWRCSKRSNTSQLMLGCARFYLRFELLKLSGASASRTNKHGNKTPADHFQCPICGLPLRSCSPAPIAL